VTAAALSPDTDRRLVALILERGLANREAVDSVRNEWSLRAGRGEHLPSLAQLLCERNVLDRGVAARLLQEVRGRRTSSVGSYALGRELGRGGMGRVCRSRAKDGTEVAVKVMNLAADPEVLVGFDRERRLLASLGEADGFVPILDSGVDGERAYLVMPLLAGGTLREKLDGRTLRPREAAELVLQLARALGKAHARGIIHRDLKPANILFTQAGLPLVADLGLGKHFRHDVDGGEGSIAYSVTGTVAGTTGYMSPEQLEDSKRAGPACDVFALGVILYECVAGVRPFLGPGMLAYAEALRSQPVPLKSAARRVPAWLDEVVLRALARDPKARFADGEELARALEDGLAVRPLSPLTLGLLGLAALAVVITVAVAKISGGPPSPGTPTPPQGGAPLPPPAPTAPPATPPVAPTGPTGAPATTPVAPMTPASAEASRREQRAMEKFLRRDFEGALADIDRALELEPARAMLWCERGEIKQNLGDLTSAVADYSEAIARDEKLVSAWRLRGAARGSLGDLPAAEADLTRAIELDGRDASDFQNRGFARVKMENVRGALADVYRAVELDPTLVSAWILRGVLRAETGDADGGIADLTHALELSPGNVEVFVQRATAYLVKGDAGRATRDMESAAAIAPSDERLPLLRSRIEELKKKR
jgi:serine/threonine protein kinase/Tfp pilus assembly protein PilF